MVDKGREHKKPKTCMFYFFTSMGWCGDGGRSQHLKVSSIMVFWELGPSQTFFKEWEWDSFILNPWVDIRSTWSI